MGMLDWFPNPFRRSAPAPTRDPWDILKRPLDVEKLKTAVPIPAFLPYFDEQQTAGETLAMRFAYRFMLADPFVKSALLGKLLSVMSTELQVRPPKKFKNDPRHQMIAEFVEWNLTDGLAGGVPSLCWAILSGGCIDGLSVSEKVWDVEDTGQWRGKRVLSDLKPKDVNQDLVVNIDEFKNITSIRGLRYNGGEEFDVHDFVIYAHLPLFGNPTGMSDFRAAYGAYWIRDTVKKLRGMGAERYAFPTVIGEYPEASKKQALDLALSKMRSQTWATVPAGVKITVLDLAGSGPDKLQNLDRDLREEIVTGIQGSIAQTMMGGENQQRGNSETQETKGNLFGWHLSAAVVHLLNARKNGLIRDLVDRNFADVQEYPKAIFGGVDEGEAKESLDIDKGLKELGYEPADIEEVQERYGRKLVKVQQPGGGVGPDGQPLPPGAGPTPPGAPPTPGAEPPAVPPEVGPEVAGEPQEGPADDLGDPAERADAMADIVGGSLGDEEEPEDDPDEKADLMGDIVGGALAGPEEPAKFSEDADGTRGLADWYADLWNERPPTHAQLDAAHDELSGGDWIVNYDTRSGEWHVSPAGVAFAERAPKGGVTIDGKFYRGGMFIPGKEVDKLKAAAESGDEGAKADLAKLDASKGEHEKRKADRTADRKAKGLSIAELKAKTDPHQYSKVSALDRVNAKRAYNALKMHHVDAGTVGHRLRELIDDLHTGLAEAKAENPQNVGQIRQIRQRLRLYGNMLDWGLKEGVIHDEDGIAGTVGGGADGAGSAGASEQRILTAREGQTKRVSDEEVERLIPGDLRQHLTAEQTQGVALGLLAMQEHGGFLNADSTGVGKTRQELATAKILAGKGRKVLLVSTAAIIQPNWSKGTIDENTSMFRDSQAMGVPWALNNGTKALQAGQVHLTTYESLGRIKDKIDKDTDVIFDEAHYIKNVEAQRGQHGHEIADKAGSVQYDTATPGDQPEHLAYLFRTKLFGDKSWKEVRGDFNDDKIGSEAVLSNIDHVFRQLTEKGLMVRRELSLDNLDVHMDRVTLPQEAHDELAKIAANAKTGGAASAASAMMQSRLRQERHKIPQAAKGAAEEIAAGRQVILFVGGVNAPEGSAEGTKGSAALLREHLASQGINDVVEYHSGPTADDDAVGKFDRGEARVFITTIPSGSTGINLDDTKGDRPRTAMVVTPPWTANENIQLAGRILRLKTKGRAKLRYMFGDTDVDRHNYDLLSSKMKTIKAVVQGETQKLDLGKQTPAAFDEEDNDDAL